MLSQPTLVRLTALPLLAVAPTLACDRPDRRAASADGPLARSVARLPLVEVTPADSGWRHTQTDTSRRRLVAVPGEGTARLAGSSGATHVSRFVRAPLEPNELGRIPILEYHLVGATDGRWERSHEQLRRDLELLYERGYRPVSVSDILDRRLDLPRGMSPIVFTFDDASPSQFRFVERNGRLEIDPTSAVGIWLDFARTHTDWGNKAVFCLLSGAEAGRSFFGDKDIEGQKSEWRFLKVRFLAERGFELCNHTLWHANLGRYPDDFVQEQIARAALAIDSVVPGYRVRTFALPLGVWPRNKPLARQGIWRDARTSRTIGYDHDAILLVTGQPVRSPYDPAFDPLRLERVQVFGDELERLLDRMERSGVRYVSDGDPATVAGPARGEVRGARGENGGTQRRAVSK